MSRQAILQANGLTTGYRASGKNEVVVAKNVDLGLTTGELVFLLGPNGGGKSTLIRTLCGLQPPLAGTIQIDGIPTDELTGEQLARKLAVVLTERTVPIAMTAHAVVALGRHPHTNWLGQLSDEDEEIIQRSLQEVGADKLAHREVSELSDGERQKVMIARALAQETEILVLDEPTAFLDLPRRVELTRLLKRLAVEQNKAILCSTHDLDLALRSADRIALLPGDETMIIDAPEDLVLNGQFSRVFDAGEIRFDRAKGTFEIHEGKGPDVRVLSNDPILRLWTARALERIGINVILDEVSDCPRSVEATTDDQGPRWISRHEENSDEFHTLRETIDHLKTITKG